MNLPAELRAAILIDVMMLVLEFIKHWLIVWIVVGTADEVKRFP